jgi:beta-barrel assembly-enhancing protease
MGYEGYPPSRRRGIGGRRLLIALILAVVAIISYYSRTEVNPVTGEKQRVAMNVDQEKALGLESAPQMAREMGGVLDPSTDAQARAVAEMGRRLIEKTEAAESPYADNFNFHLLADPQTINAFALPGGQIFITRGLYSRLENESELAGVLSHEVGHVINRHSAEQMAKGQLGQMLAGAVAVGADDGEGGGQRAAMIAAMVNQMVQLKYGRGDESESDAYGMKIMADAGYDPNGMLQLMYVLKEAGGGGRQPEMLSSHPLPETRIEEIKTRIQRTYPEGVPAELTRGGRLPGV